MKVKCKRKHGPQRIELANTLNPATLDSVASILPRTKVGEAGRSEGILKAQMFVVVLLSRYEGLQQALLIELSIQSSAQFQEITYLHS